MRYIGAGVLASALVLALTVSPSFAQDSSIAGQWELTLVTPLGLNNVGLTLQLDADKVSGELKSPLGMNPVAGTFSDGSLVLTTNIQFQDMLIPVGLRASLAADALSGTMKIGDLGEFAFTGKRPMAGADPVAAAKPGVLPDGTSTVPDASGRWDVVLSIAGLGEFPLTATLKQDGTNVTGTLNSFAGDVTVNGTMTGPSLKIEFAIQTPQGSFPVTLTGQLAGDQFAGKASVGVMGEADWKATRRP